MGGLCVLLSLSLLFRQSVSIWVTAVRRVSLVLLGKLVEAEITEYGCPNSPRGEHALDHRPFPVFTGLQPPR